MNHRSQWGRTFEFTTCGSGRSPRRARTPWPLAVGIDALMESFSVFRNHRSGAWKIITHFMGNLNYNRLEGDVAETETNAIAFLVLPDTPKEQVTMRSLRYLDRLGRTPQGWRICERQHTLDWSCHVPTSYSLAIGQRILKRAVL